VLLLVLVLLLRNGGRLTHVPERPALAPWYRVAGEGEQLVFEHGHRAVVLEGAAVRALVARLLPLLDGTRTVPELGGRLGVPVEPALANALRVLAERGLLVEGPRPDGPLRDTAEEIAAACRLSPARVAAALAEARVGVAGESRVADETARLLAAAGLAPVERVPLTHAARFDLLLAAPGHDELTELERVNARALTSGVPWVQVLPYDGRISAVGPLFLPGTTACRTCFQLRRAAALRFGSIEETLAAAPLRAPAGPALETLAAAVAVVTVLRWLGARDPAMPGVLHALELEHGPRVTAHRVLRVPRCPACSSAHRRARPAPWFDPTRREAA
jgi:bacteriocin biosynthesis cyclodehydratase domain-containing protein